MRPEHRAASAPMGVQRHGKQGSTLRRTQSMQQPDFLPPMRPEDSYDEAVGGVVRSLRMLDNGSSSIDASGAAAGAASASANGTASSNKARRQSGSSRQSIQSRGRQRVGSAGPVQQRKRAALRKQARQAGPGAAQSQPQSVAPKKVTTRPTSSPGTAHGMVQRTAHSRRRRRTRPTLRVRPQTPGQTAAPPVSSKPEAGADTAQDAGPAITSTSSGGTAGRPRPLAIDLGPVVPVDDFADIGFFDDGIRLPPSAGPTDAQASPVPTPRLRPPDFTPSWRGTGAAAPSPKAKNSKAPPQVGRRAAEFLEAAAHATATPQRLRAASRENERRWRHHTAGLASTVVTSNATLNQRFAFNER